MKNTYGFSLIELLVVVAIIAVLAAIALPTYTIYASRAKLSGAVTILNDMAQSVMRQVDAGKNLSSALTYNNYTINSGSGTAVNIGVVGQLYYLGPGGVASTRNLNSNEYLVVVDLQSGLTGEPGFNPPSTIAAGLVMRLQLNSNGTWQKWCGRWTPSTATDPYDILQSYLPPGCTCNNVDTGSC